VSAHAHLESFFGAWMRHDPDEMAGFYADDAVMHDPTLSEPRRGRAAVRGYYADMFGELEDPEHRLVDWAERGGRVWFEWTFASGGGRRQRRSYRGVSVQTLRDGRIARDDAFWDPNA
jgi:ketosteroid isomerase-like protein